MSELEFSIEPTPEINPNGRSDSFIHAQDGSSLTNEGSGINRRAVVSLADPGAAGLPPVGKKDVVSCGPTGVTENQSSSHDNPTAISAGGAWQFTHAASALNMSALKRFTCYPSEEKSIDLESLAKATCHVTRVINENPKALGTWLLVCNRDVPESIRYDKSLTKEQNKELGNLKPLDGIENGTLQIKNCVANLGLAVVYLENPTKEYLMAVIQVMSLKMSQPIKYPESYRYFFYYGTGHGADLVFFTKDGSVSYSDVYQPFQGLFQQRFFFFDNCRSSRSDDVSKFPDGNKRIPTLPEFKLLPGNRIVYAAESGTESLGPGEGISFMTRKMINLLKERISMDELIRRLPDEVTIVAVDPETGKTRSQRPATYSATPGTVHLWKELEEMQPVCNDPTVHSKTISLKVDIKQPLAINDEGSIYQSCEVKVREYGEQEWQVLDDVGRTAYASITNSDLPAEVNLRVRRPTGETSHFEMCVVAHYSGGLSLESKHSSITVPQPKITKPCCGLLSLGTFFAVAALILLGLVFGNFANKEVLSVLVQQPTTSKAVEMANGLFQHSSFSTCALSFDGWSITGGTSVATYCAAYNESQLGNSKPSEFDRYVLYQKNKMITPGHYSLPFTTKNYFKNYTLKGSKAVMDVCHANLSHDVRLSTEIIMIKTDDLDNFVNSKPVDPSSILNETSIEFDSDHLCHSFNLTTSVSSFVSFAVATSDTLNLSVISASLNVVYYDDHKLHLVESSNKIVGDTKLVPGRPDDVLLCLSETNDIIYVSVIPMISFILPHFLIVVFILIFSVLVFVLCVAVCCYKHCCKRRCRRRYTHLEEEDVDIQHVQ